MKALSVKQPWAGNIAVGYKTAEIRPRKIKPQGDILICSTQQPFENIGRLQCNNHKLWLYPDNDICENYGRAIAIVNWHETVRFTKDLCDKACFDVKRWPFGYFEFENSINYWAWMFQNARLVKPFLIKGQQGIFEVDEKLIEYL